jgi:hypothetical protein
MLIASGAGAPHERLETHPEHRHLRNSHNKWNAAGAHPGWRGVIQEVIVEDKRGILMAGIVLLICMAAMAVLVVVGWTRLNAPGATGLIQNLFTQPPIDMEGNEFDAFIRGLGYACDDEKTLTSREVAALSCTRQVEDYIFTLEITYSRKENKPFSVDLSVNQSDREGQIEVIAGVFSDLIRIPYKGSYPDAAASWMNDCWDFRDIDSLTSSKEISGVTFLFSTYDGRYRLTIGTKYPYE